MANNPRIKKGEQPPWLKDKDFRANPQNINRYGIPSDVVALKKMVQEMGNEEIILDVGKGKNKKQYQMTRFQRILIDWFESQSFEKQQAIMQYGIGKVPDKLEVSGELKVIKVSLKKKGQAVETTETSAQEAGAETDAS